MAQAATLSVTELRPRGATIGGSRAGAVCGVDRFKSPVAVWHEMTSGVEPESSEQAEWGARLERTVLEYIDAERHPVALPLPVALRDEARPYIVGHPDAATTLDGADAILEVKTGGLWLHAFLNDELRAPPWHVLQVMHYLHLTGWDVGLLAYLVAGQEYREVLVERDDALIAAMLERYAAFMGLVRRKVPPAPAGGPADREAVRALYPSAAGGVVRLMGDDWQAVRHARLTAERLDYAKREHEAALERIQIAMGDATEALSPWDETVATWTNTESTRLNTKALRAERPDIYAAYAEAHHSRRFTLK